MQAGCKAHEHPVFEPWGPSSPVTPVTEAKSPPRERIWAMQRKVDVKDTHRVGGFQETTKRGNASLAYRGGTRLG